MVVGQYGFRAAGQPGALVSYVSDAFGYREVDAAAGPVKVVSREQAIEQLPEARRQLAELRAAEAESESAVKMEMSPEEEVAETKSAAAEGAVDGAGDVLPVMPEVAAVVSDPDDAVVTEALPEESVVEPAEPQYWASPPVYAAALPYHAPVYPYHPAAYPYQAASYPYHPAAYPYQAAVYPYQAADAGYQYQTVHMPGQYGYQRYQWLPYSVLYPYLAPAATAYRYQQPAASVRAKYQYPAPENPLFEAHLYLPVVSEDEVEESR